jgi:hypothetical protein
VINDLGFRTDFWMHIWAWLRCRYLFEIGRISDRPCADVMCGSTWEPCTHHQRLLGSWDGVTITLQIFPDIGEMYVGHLPERPHFRIHGLRFRSPRDLPSQPLAYTLGEVPYRE